MTLRVSRDVGVAGESELVALEESVTRALHLVRQARIEGCARTTHARATHARVLVDVSSVTLHRLLACVTVTPLHSLLSCVTLMRDIDAFALTFVLCAVNAFAALESAKRSAQEQQARVCE